MIWLSTCRHNFIHSSELFVIYVQHLPLLLATYSFSRMVKHFILSHVNVLPLTNCKDGLMCLTRSRVSIIALFLCTMRMYPGGCIQASPSTWTGTGSSPRMVTFTCRHWRHTTPTIRLTTHLSLQISPLFKHTQQTVQNSITLTLTTYSTYCRFQSSW